MGRTYWAGAIFALQLVPPAFGQYVATIQACSQDFVQFCAPDRSDGSRLTECVETHFPDFTEPCKAALAKSAAVRETCRTDVREHCPDVRPGAGRVLLCVKQHFAALSEPCKEAIGREAERKVRAH